MPGATGFEVLEALRHGEVPAEGGEFGDGDDALRAVVHLGRTPARRRHGIDDAAEHAAHVEAGRVDLVLDEQLGDREAQLRGGEQRGGVADREALEQRRRALEDSGRMRDRALELSIEISASLNDAQIAEIVGWMRARYAPERPAWDHLQARVAQLRAQSRP